ncbi:hypothetical protein BJX61DRAFT_528943 [Aspergillus egyptiacus]|nr:hypothetical protein BJX61DRAFT_528943 [Aspergillus egyptiacus]
MSDIQDLRTLYRPTKRPFEELDEMNEDVIEDLKRTSLGLSYRWPTDPLYWAVAADVEWSLVGMTRLMADELFTFSSCKRKEWQTTAEARVLAQRMHAHMYRITAFEDHEKKLEKKILEERRPWRRCRRWLEDDFKAPLPTPQTCDFRSRLFKYYQSVRPDHPEQGWCPVTHAWVDIHQLTTSAIFPWKHGLEIMDTIFGEIRPQELVSPRNGIVMHKAIRQAFDIGVLAIVPDLKDSQKPKEWANQKSPEYKIRIIDQTWEMLHQEIYLLGIRWKDLDGRRLEFRGSVRPAPRYLFYHYCVQILRCSWSRWNRSKQIVNLYDEYNRPYWPAHGEFIDNGMLKRLTKELGSECRVLRQGFSRKSSVGKDEVLLETIAMQIAESNIPGVREGKEDHLPR